MRIIILSFSCLLAFTCFNLCKTQETKHEIYTEADSLLSLTLALQLRIGSPEIQRIHDFQEEISRDLTLFSPVPAEDSPLTRYRELYDGLDKCMQACSEYHEEAFLLESSLREIMERIQIQGANARELEELLQFEADNYNDLSVRVDSSVKTAIRHADSYYSLKSEIDKLKGQAQLP